MPAPKRYHARDFQNTLGVNKVFGIPQSIHQINSRLLKLGYAALPLRNMQLAAQLAKAGLVNDNLVQWYQAAHGVTQSSNAVSQWLNLAPSRLTLNKNLQQITAANMPTLLAHAGGIGNNYGFLNGTVANNFTTPDAAFPTTQLEVVARVSSVDWTPSTAQIIAAKMANNSTQETFYFGLNTNGTIFYGVSSTGAVITTATSTVAPSFIDGNSYWVKATWNSATGIVQFFTAADQVTEPTVWSQLGANVTGVQTGNSLFDSTSPIEIGVYLTASQLPWNGRIYSVAIRGTIGGANAFFFDTSHYTSGTTFTASTGEVWTINGGAIINTASSIYFDGVNDFLKTGSFTLNQPETIYLVGRQVTWTQNNVIYDGDTSSSTLFYQRSITPAVGLNAGIDQAGNVTWPVQTVAIDTSIWNSTNSISRINRGTPQARSVGTNNMSGFTLGSIGNGGSLWSNIAISEVLIFNTAHSTAQQDIVIGYLNEKYSLGL